MAAKVPALPCFAHPWRVFSVNFPSSAGTDIVFMISCVGGKEAAPAHVLHLCGFLLGMQVDGLWSLTWGLAQASNFNCLKSYSRIWVCLLGRTGMLMSPWLLTEGRTATTAAPRKAGCNLEFDKCTGLMESI